MRKKINKTGALSMQFIIIMIILVVSFAVILGFYYAFDWTGEIDKQACHQSVIYKATVPDLLEKKVVELPLNCKTEKICITSSREGNCDDDYLGEEYETIRLKGDRTEWDGEINKILRDKLYECWWMMGQGQVQLYSRDFLQKKICTICTRIVFDREIQEDREKVRGLLSYLSRSDNIVPNSDKTYWQYLRNSNTNEIVGGGDEDFVSTNPKAIVFAEVDAGAWAKWTFQGAGVVGGAVAGAYVGGAIGSIVPGPGTVVGAGIGGVIGLLGTGEVSEEVDNFFNENEVASAWQIVDYDITHLKNLDCASFEGKL